MEPLQPWKPENNAQAWFVLDALRKRLNAFFPGLPFIEAVTVSGDGATIGEYIIELHSSGMPDFVWSEHKCPLRAFATCLFYVWSFDKIVPLSKWDESQSTLYFRIYEEVFGPAQETDRWGLTMDVPGTRKSPAWQAYWVPILQQEKKRKVCKTAEDHFFATALGGGKCFICDKTAEEVYRKV